MLTKTQSRLLAYLIKFQKKKGYCPSYRELARGMGWKSSNTPHLVVIELEKKGFVITTKGSHRSIEVIRRKI